MLVSIDPPRLAEILVEERVAETATGIRQQSIDWPAFRRGIELVHTFGRRKIGLDSFDFPAQRAE